MEPKVAILGRQTIITIFPPMAMVIPTWYPRDTHGCEQQLPIFRSPILFINQSERADHEDGQLKICMKVLVANWLVISAVNVIISYIGYHTWGDILNIVFKLRMDCDDCDALRVQVHLLAVLYSNQMFWESSFQEIAGWKIRSFLRS